MWGVWHSLGSLNIVNVSDPYHPVEIGSSYTQSDGAVELYVDDNFVYVSDKSYGLRIIDATDPTNPEEIGYYDTGDITREVQVVNSLIYVADDSDGLYIIRYTGDAGIKEYKISEEGVSLLNVNSGINIQFSLTESKKVKVEIFNILGQRIEKLMDGVSPTGMYNLKWTGNTGVYFVRVEIGDKVYRKKAIILRQLIRS